MKLLELFNTLALTTVFAISSPAILLVQQNKVLADAGSSILKTNESLNAGESIVSPDGNYKAVLQYDGNFVLYDSTNTPIWNSGTYNTSAKYIVMQQDCNLVIYGFNSNVIWASYTTVGSNCSLQMQNDGNLVIYRADNTAIWVNGSKLY